MTKKDKKNGKKSQQLAQQEGAPPGKKSAINSIEKQNIIAENAEKDQKIEKPNVQTIQESRTQNNDIDKKGSKKEKTKSKRPTKPKKAGFFGNLFSIKRIFLFYILAVLFWCNGKTQKQCNSYEEAICFNGISQYILNHDFFQKYIEPTIIAAKQNVDVYGKKALDTASVHYEIRAKPYVDPLLKSAQPRLQNARESVRHIYAPIVEGLTKAYNDNARKHVDNYYDQAIRFSAPYVNQAQEHASYTYEQALEYNKNTVQPWYRKKVVPFVIGVKDKVNFYYDTKMAPFVYHNLEIIKEIYHKKIVPACHKVWKFIQKLTEKKIKAEVEKEEKIKAEAEKKAKEEADKKAKAERKAKEEADKKAKAERKAKEEADKKAKAERKAKEEADKKAKAERKAKEEADKKAEAEKKAKEEADKKAAEKKVKEANEKAGAERKAKEEAEKRAEAEKKAKEEAVIRDAFLKEFPLIRENLTLALDNYERKATSVAQKTLYEVEARIAKLKNSGSEYLVKLKKIVEQIKKDSTKDRKAKFNEITDLAKKFIDNIKENSQKFIEISKNSINSLEEEKFDELKKEFDLILVSQIYEARENIYNLVQNRKQIDDKLKTDIDTTTKNMYQEFNENKNSASLRVREIFAIINNKINLLASTKNDVIKDIHSYVKAEKDNLKSEVGEKTVKKNKKDDNTPNVESQDAHKNDNQIPVQQKPSTVKASSDPILEKLKARQDSVLDKLKKGYELFKAEKGNESAVQVQPIDDEEEYYDDESDECTSDD